MIEFEISSGYIATLGVGLAITGWNLLLQIKVREIGILFRKNDENKNALHDYKLYVAETYISRENLKEILEPIRRSLERIQEHLDKQ